ncbi:MAG TPA: glycoside hydrolase family 9 protein [Gemmatimonadaceae bacterium]|nr:glycoside hydrolase family 9 protein [Gemmatimonadaceae bacterium]
MAPPPARLVHGVLVLAAAALGVACAPTRPELRLDPNRHAIRINQVGYLPGTPKVAVLCSLDTVAALDFTVETADGRRVLGPVAGVPAPPFGPCASTHRLDFSGVREEGSYRLVAAGVHSPPVRISRTAYEGVGDSLLFYMRQQRSGYNPFFRDSVHKKDALLVDHPTRSGEFIPVSGGWADAADYLQYVTTSANATYVMMMAHRESPRAFGDGHRADGLPGPNGISDVLDEARHGLEWLLRMFPEDSLMLNQLGDDRDHAFPDLPTTDSSDYGWGKGGPRPVYPCTGKPQGLFAGKNRSTGFASTAGKYASAFALGAQMLAEHDPSFAQRLRARALVAYEIGRARPGVCQTAPGRSPYFYEEDNWADDMELGATQLYQLTRASRYLAEAVEYARMEPVTPWMGADTANHYQWYPWHNNGHFELWRAGGDAERGMAIAFYRDGLERVARRADNGFRVGIPFIWCSANLMVSLATQARLYREMSGDARFLEMEMAALDWLFGANPWGMSMVIGIPRDGVFPRDPHSIVAKQLGVVLTGGLIDGPVYGSIFQNLKGIHLTQADEFAPFNSGHIVYHDDFGDYSTNEPIMDGTANLTYLVGALARDGARSAP